MHSLWVAFAKLYEQHGDLANARFIYGKAAEVSVWALRGGWWIEMARGCAGSGALRLGKWRAACGSQGGRTGGCCIFTRLTVGVPAPTARGLRFCLDPPQPTTPSPPTSQVPYKYVDDLATIYCEWAEMEMRAKAYKKALALMRTATTPPQRPRTREVGTLGSRGGDAHWAPGSLAPGTRSPAVKSAWRPCDVAGFSCCPGSRNPQ